LTAWCEIASRKVCCPDLACSLLCARLTTAAAIPKRCGLWYAAPSRKAFATTGLGAGGNQSISNEQIQGVCSEAEAAGLRAVVHSIGDSGARAAVLAGRASMLAAFPLAWC
jgi:imidazolonepropionase-like amidohydrolase